MAERRMNLGTIFLALGSIIMLFEIVGMFTGIFVGPDFLYFLGGVLEGVGVVFVLSGFVIREEFTINNEMM